MWLSWPWQEYEHTSIGYLVYGLASLNATCHILKLAIPGIYRLASTDLMSTGRSSHSSPALSVEIRAPFELGQILGSGEVIGELQMSWDELLDHGDEPFGVHPSLKLKATIVHACDNQDDALFDLLLTEHKLQSLVDCEITQDTDAGHAQFAAYMTSKTVSDLNDAVKHFQLVLDQCPVSHPDHATALTNLARARLQGYIRNHLEDINATTSFFRDALALRVQPHPNHPLSLYNLTEVLAWRHNKKRTAADIREAAQLYHELLPLCPEGTYLHSIATGKNGIDYVIGGCNNLPKDTSDEGKPDDLNEAISLHEEALHLCLVGHKSRDVSLDNLGGVLVHRFNEHGNIDDITRAISLYWEALTLRPPGHPRSDTTLNNLALTLKIRYDKSKTHVSEDLNEAIDLYRKTLRLKWLDHPERYKTLLNLSSVLCSRFMQTQKNEDVEEAIVLCQQSLEALHSLHPDRHHLYLRLQEAYMSRYCMQYNPADLALAVDNFRLASRHPTQGFPNCIIQAYEWAVAAEQHGHGSALEAYSAFLELLDAHLATQLSATSQHEAAAAFHYARSLPVDAASCAIRHDDLPRTVELVEQGRGQQWSLASRLRTPVEDLKSANLTLVCNYLELSKRVSNAAQSSATITDRAAADREATEYRRLTRQWEATVAEIRDLPVFSQFLLPPSCEDLQAAACQGPVIILIASQYSCSTIIVPTSGDPHHVPLPSVTLADLTNIKDCFARAIRDSSWMNPGELRTDLIVLSQIIWDQIMLPIINVLKHVLKLKCRSRIWLCPTAAFTSIPLHAAHPFQTKADRSGKEPCLEDLYICSYTPTLLALIRSRQLMKKRAPLSFVAIGQGQPGAGKGKALLAVDSELELVHKLVPVTANCTTISGNAATQAGTLSALQQNTWVHLACHGKQDPKQPYDSHFVMRDEHLMLLNIMERHLLQAEFAFLSACHTTIGNEETPNEVIHLAAGLQFSGFKSIIGTLWEVDDSVATHVIEAFYKYMFGDLKDGGVMDCTKVAWALNCAMHSVKTKVPLEQRMVFVHIGV
ncbi:CHAT domain-containing protein [Suillus variegatus]|nr:CHAT domain-containing protein [Suillus variegatus]